MWRTSDRMKERLICIYSVYFYFGVFPSEYLFIVKLKMFSNIMFRTLNYKRQFHKIVAKFGLEPSFNVIVFIN